MLLTTAAVIAGTLYISWQLYLVIYNIYLHPLASFPGPKAWIAFPILRYISAASGTFDKHMMRFHEQYGEVVRFTDDHLSFSTAQAWKDIYGYGHGQHQWPKREFRPPGAKSNILFSDDETHAKYRKALAHSFSEQALRLQESLIKRYVDMLVVSLREEADAERAVDMTMWYNLTTFDIISDLAFGEPSNCLETKGYTPYVDTMFKFIKIVPFIHLMRFYPIVWKTISLFIGKRVLAQREALFKIGTDTAMKRKNDPSKNGRGDFMEGLLKHSEQKEHIPDAELASNAHILFLAGSETTATLLAGVTFWLLRTPDALRQTVSEVRKTFKREQDINFSSASAKLPFLLACLEEGLRMYPPVPTVLVRTTTEDANISGYIVPKGVHVGVHQMATNMSGVNFAEPELFRPDRWLLDASTNSDSTYFRDNREARQPFGVGPRNCIGKNLAFSEMRVILARVLWNFDLELVNRDQDWANQKVYTLWEKGPLLCRIQVRGRKDREGD